MISLKAWDHPNMDKKAKVLPVHHYPKSESLSQHACDRGSHVSELTFTPDTQSQQCSNSIDNPRETFSASICAKFMACMRICAMIMNLVLFLFLNP